MTPYRLDVISLFPEAFSRLKELGVIGRAFESGIAELHIHNPRDYAKDHYRKVDDLPYGGGAGMVLKPEPFFEAFESIPLRRRSKKLLLTPQGRQLIQSDLLTWAQENDQLIFFCGNYEGFDERIRTLVDEEISLGDFILTGGEIPAMVLINGLVRLLPGTVGSQASLLDESHSEGLLEHPHYTRPADFRGMVVPEVLRSGDHAAIAYWRQNQRERRTKVRRPDLYARWLKKQNLSTLTKMDESLSELVDLRIGNGYDIHRLVSGRPLIIGGVLLEHPEGKGLQGHSDADVLVHAVMDALLGALALGDIGKYFPPEDPNWKGSDSLQLLEEVVKLVINKGWKVVNVDAVVIAERPKLKPHIDLMRKNLAAKLDLSVDSVGVKATTNESLGPEGREKGISCQAVALLQKK